MLSREIDSLDAAACLHDPVPAGLDEIVEQLHVEFVILNNEHGLLHRAFHWA